MILDIKLGKTFLRRINFVVDTNNHKNREFDPIDNEDIIKIIGLLDLSLGGVVLV